MGQFDHVVVVGYGRPPLQNQEKRALCGICIR